MPDPMRVLKVLAEQADARARRRATTVPVLATMAGAALATELRLRAEDDEKVLAALGITFTSPLRHLADRVPAITESAASLALRAERSAADALDRLSRR